MKQPKEISREKTIPYTVKECVVAGERVRVKVYAPPPGRDTGHAFQNQTQRYSKFAGDRLDLSVEPSWRN